MKAFMDKDFLLSTETAQELYHNFAAQVPVLDYHCHINPQEIAEDRKFENITQVWLGGDHYKWRQMRSNGVDEYYITGDAPDREKFQKWAETLEKAIGNPLFHWSHLELQRYFGYTGVLNGETAEEVWNLCNAKLQEDSMSVRNLIKQSNVTLLCTTDDPIDDLKWHKVIKEDETFDVQVLPAWRPDKATNVEKPDFVEYLGKLSQVSGVEIKTFADLKEAIAKRMEYFDSMGCSISDHGLDYVMYAPASDEEVERIFADRLAGKEITKEDAAKYKTAFMLFLAGKYLPKTILYSLNPGDDELIGTILGCFQNSDAIGKIQQGSAWWFNDNKTGMMKQMTSLANLGLLGNFIGMLTDSRSFLSYPRHEYFRRIMCELIGGWVENGEYPKDMKNLEKIVKGISYNNAVRYFGFDLETK